MDPGVSTWPRPRQLPAGTGHFTGRGAELAELDRILLRRSPGSPPIVFVTGMAGAGKTSLVINWAQHAADAFPDGQLYADLQGHGPGEPLEPEAVLAAFLRALGRDRSEEIPTAAERAALFRSLLSGKRVLLVLDNVQSANQVRLLVPGVATCSVVIVGRRYLPGLAVHHAVERVKVDRLPTTDAVRLLEVAIGDRVTREPASARVIAKQCGGLPLALRIVAERAVARPHRSLERLADQLSSEHARLALLETGEDPETAVRTAFSWTYRGLPEPEADAFRAIGSHPGRLFGIHAIAALTGEPVRRAESTVDGLVAAHLVTERGPDRYEMHDLLRLYAVELSERRDEPELRDAGLLRLYDHYLHTADRANRVLMPHRLRIPCPGTAPFDVAFADRQSALDWLDTELVNLVAMCRLTGPEFDVRCFHLAYTMRDYFFLTKRVDSWLETHTLAWQACRRTGDRRAEARTLNNLGRAALESGDVKTASGHYTLAHRLFEEMGDEHGSSNSLANLASVLRRSGDHEGALAHLTRALEFYRGRAKRNFGITLRSMARAETELGRFQEAVRDAEKALSIAVELDLDLDAAQAAICLGRAHFRRGDPGAARGAYLRASGFSDRAGSDHEKASSLRHLGEVAAHTGDSAEAGEYWRAALELYRKLGSPVADELAGRLAALDAEQGPVPRPDVS